LVRSLGPLGGDRHAQDGAHRGIEWEVAHDSFG